MTPPAPEWLVWLEQSAAAVFMRRALWAYPAAEIVHLAGVVLLVGPAVMFDLRLLGLSAHLPATALARHLLPWSRRGLVLVALSGAALFVSHAPEWVASPAFRLKMAAVTAAGLNALVFHRRAFRTAIRWDAATRPPRAARVAAVLSLLLWGTAIACGRLMAYV